MQYCEACKIHIRGNKKCCPLCGGALSGEASESGYPVLGPAKNTWASMARVVSVIAVAFVIVMGTVGMITDFRNPLVLLMIAGALILWIDLLLNSHYQHNVIKLLTAQTYIGIIAALGADWLSGYRGWSVTWVIPFAFVGIAVVTLSVARGLRLRLSEYIFYLVLDALASLIQILFLCLHLEKALWPPICSMAILTVGAVAALIFRRRELQTAMTKVFHA